MAEPLVTIAIVPRERFSLTRRSLESLLAHSDPATPLVYVDGGSPPLVRQYLEQQAVRRGLRLVSTEKLVAPNVARNLAASFVRTRYVAFVDNDVVVPSGWLEPLVDCAESTGAWVVGPVCCQGEPLASRVCSAGGTVDLVEENGSRQLRQGCRHQGRTLAQLGDTLPREPTGQVAFHAALVRTDVFQRLGPLDEQLQSALAHTDLCLQVRRRGGQVFLEPGSVVTYVAPPPFEAYDLPYFELRWSEAWNAASIAHFRRKWDLAENDSALAELAESLAAHRRLTLEPWRRALRLLGRRSARWVENAMIAPLERAINRRKFPQVRRAVERPLRKAA